MTTSSTTAPTTLTGVQIDHLLDTLTEKTTATVQQPGASGAEVLTPLAEQLARVAPQLAALPEADRAHLRDKFTALLALLDNAINRLSTARDETRQQLTGLRNRATALAAYRPK